MKTLQALRIIRSIVNAIEDKAPSRYQKLIATIKALLVEAGINEN